MRSRLGRNIFSNPGNPFDPAYRASSQLQQTHCLTYGSTFGAVQRSSQPLREPLVVAQVIRTSLNIRLNFSLRFRVCRSFSCSRKGSKLLTLRVLWF
ncbi:hypothetical protein HanXRQr2_Chr01g0028061 [Helianthus annuus]|uniref:Uncharacterized protein n=1 Tax=Helianthus annuus TaxID=4232 RepID=A0A9K3P4Z7_HELAN|nr:hypothetical protein HanXRQr2_Chr01g0028061 [Helianthus annuus]KAJ0957409.1 hypothetical protein HanPSC8_Chr01g0026981 [Helianthus annuus]